MDITFYDTTGKITGVANFRDDLADMVKSLEGSTHPHIDGNHFSERATKYVLDGAIADRPANPAVLTGASLSALPVPCSIRINATSYDCTEATADLTFSHPGTYTITVTAWPYQDKVFTYENPA